MRDGVEQSCQRIDESYPSFMAFTTSLGHLVTQALTLHGINMITAPRPIHIIIFHALWIYVWWKLDQRVVELKFWRVFTPVPDGDTRHLQQSRCFGPNIHTYLILRVEPVLVDSRYTNYKDSLYGCISPFVTVRMYSAQFHKVPQKPANFVPYWNGRKHLLLW